MGLLLYQNFGFYKKSTYQWGYGLSKYHSRIHLEIHPATGQAIRRGGESETNIA
jgi:hypothetical protein